MYRSLIVVRLRHFQYSGKYDIARRDAVLVLYAVLVKELVFKQQHTQQSDKITILRRIDRRIHLPRLADSSEVLFSVARV